MSHVDSEIRFDELDLVTLIVGVKRGNTKSSNGAGKSALFDAITWALYEKSRASGSASTGIDNIVKGGADKAEVEFHFRLGEDLYRVVRTRDQKRRKSDVIFQVRSGKRWQSVGADGKKGTAKKIVNTIGLEYDVFVNSVLLEQHEASAFAKMTSGERKDVITKILQLGHYDDYGAQAKKRLEKLNELSLKSDLYIRDHSDAEQIQVEARKELKGIQDQIRAHQKRLKALQSILEDLREQQTKENKKILVLQDLLSRRDKIKARISQSTAGLKDIGVKIRKYETDLAVLKDAIAEKRESLFKIKQERGNPSLIKRDFKEWSAKVEDLTEKKTSMTVKIQTCSSQLEVLQEERQRIENMEEGSCPTCYQNISIESKQDALDVFLKKIGDYQKQIDKHRQLHKKITSALERAEKKLAEAQAQKDAFNKLQEKGRDLMKALESDQKNLVMLTESYADAKSYKKEYTDTLAVAQNELVDCLSKIEDLGDIDEDRFGLLMEEIAKRNAEIEAVTNTINGYQQRVGGLQERIETQQVVLDKIKEIKRQQGTLNRERRIEKELVNAFGKTGIQALILENSAVEIEKIANQLLSKLTDGNVNIQIQTQKPNQDGTFKEVFDIIITDEYHSSPFTMYSVSGDERVIFKDNNGHIRIENIEDLWDNAAYTLTLDESNDLSEQSTTLLPLGYDKDYHPCFQQATSLIRHKSPKNMYRLTCGPGGYNVSLTGAHSIYTLSSEGLVSKLVSDVQEGDIVLTPKVGAFPVSENKVQRIDVLDYIDESAFTNRIYYTEEQVWLKDNARIPRYLEVDADLCLMLGWAVAEASPCNQMFGFSLGDERREAQIILDLYRKIFVKQSGNIHEYQPSQLGAQATQKQYRVQGGNKLISHIFENLIGRGCDNKQVPYFLFNTTSENVEAFIRGLHSGDGGTLVIKKYSRDEKCISTTSRRLANDLVLLLRQQSKNARLEIERDKDTYKIVWQDKIKTDKWSEIPTSLFPAESFRYKKYTNGERKSFTIVEAQNGKVFNSFPKNFLKIASILEKWNALQVQRIEQIPSTTEYVYDFSVPQSQSFVGGMGGLLLHNSGGEKFRIAFVIRMALSILLSRRSGVKVSAIFYDEAFQDLDEDGIDRMMEVFRLLSQDFRHQIVITHTSQLKDYFDDVITVKKTSEGSFVSK